MDLDSIKKYDNSWWLRFLEERTVFDAKGIGETFDWLVKRAEIAEQYKSALKEIVELDGDETARQIARRVLND